MYSIQLVSIVIPTNNGTSRLKQLVKEIMQVMTGTIYKYEIIIAHYGGNEKSREIIYQLSDNFSCIKGLTLEGNYSKAAALRSCLIFAKGDVIVTMEGDMHHDPAYMPVFLAYIERGYEVVCGLRRHRPERLWLSFLTRVTQKMIYLFAGVTVKYLRTTYRAYRCYLPGNVDRIRVTHKFLNPFIAIKGTRIIDVPIMLRNGNAAFAS